MDPIAVEQGIWLGAALVTIPVSALIAFVVVFRRTPIVIDGRLIDASRRKAFDRIADAHCGDSVDQDLEAAFCEMAIQCSIESYRAFNPDSRISDKRLRERFGATCIVIGNSAVMRLHFGKPFEDQDREAMNIPIERELRLKPPVDVAPNGGGVKTKPAPVTAQQKPQLQPQARPEPKYTKRPT